MKQERMAFTQSMTWTPKEAAIDAPKAAIMAVREAETPANTGKPAPAMPGTGNPSVVAAHI